MGWECRVSNWCREDDGEGESLNRYHSAVSDTIRGRGMRGAYKMHAVEKYLNL